MNTVKNRIKKKLKLKYKYILKVMDYDLFFGKSHVKKRKTKLTKKMLDTMSLKKLKVIAKKYKVSCHKKGTKVCVKKSTLLKRLKKSRSINKILESASKMKKRKTNTRSKNVKRRSKFGKENRSVPPLTPNLSTPLELRTGQTYPYQARHYGNIPTSLISHNFQGPSGYATNIGTKGKNPNNFKFKVTSLRPSLPSYTNISSKSNFGRYFQ